MTTYVVTAKLITVKTMTASGTKAINLMAGAPVPADVTPESIAHHLSHDLIAAQPEPEPASVAAPPEPVKTDPEPAKPADPAPARPATRQGR